MNEGNFMSGLRFGIVTDVHPEDHSVDLVMLDNGARLSGVPVMTSQASGRTGSTDMTPISPDKKSGKWDISEITDQDQKAVVADVSGQPVVVGFIFPPVGQLGFSSKGMKFYRHSSDVYSRIDPDGSMEIVHPNGAFVRFGLGPEKAEVKDYHGKFKQTRNLQEGDPQMTLRIHMPDSFDLEVKPTGEVTITCDRDVVFETKKDFKIKASKITLDGNVVVTGTLKPWHG